MLIKLIQVDKQVTYFDATQIRAVQDSVKNPLLCLIVTNMLTQQGFQSFEVIGSKETIACEINQARAGKNNLM